MGANKVMTTEQYAKEIYYKYSKSGKGTQQRVRKMIADKKQLPEVINIMQSGKYYLLEVAN